MSSIEMRNKDLWDALRRHKEQTVPDRERDFETEILYHCGDTKELNSPNQIELADVCIRNHVSWSSENSGPNGGYGTLSAKQRVKSSNGDFCLGLSSLSLTSLALVLLIIKGLLSPEAATIAKTPTRRKMYFEAVRSWRDGPLADWESRGHEAFSSLSINAESLLFAKAPKSTKFTHQCFNTSAQDGALSPTTVLPRRNGRQGGLLLSDYQQKLENLKRTGRKDPKTGAQLYHRLHLENVTQKYPKGWECELTEDIPPKFTRVRYTGWVPSTGPGVHEGLKLRLSVHDKSSVVCINDISTTRFRNGGREMLSGVVIELVIARGASGGREWSASRMTHSKWRRVGEEISGDLSDQQHDIHVIVTSGEDPEWTRPKKDPESSLPAVAMRLAVQWDQDKGLMWSLLGEGLIWGFALSLLLGSVLGVSWMYRKCTGCARAGWCMCCKCCPGNWCTHLFCSCCVCDDNGANEPTQLLVDPYSPSQGGSTLAQVECSYARDGGDLPTFRFSYS
ncbi:hypothetical protein AAMO2058_001237600 [Amorphochlora amoebiformis]